MSRQSGLDILDAITSHLAVGMPIGDLHDNPNFNHSAPAALAFACLRASTDISLSLAPDLLQRILSSRVGMAVLEADLLRGPAEAFQFAGGEIFGVPADQAFQEPGSQYEQFLRRAATALRGIGYPPRFAAFIGAVLREACDNATEHAQARSIPLVCYQVAGPAWSVAVVDSGCGVLASLKQNHRFSALRSDIEALRLALKDGVSRVADDLRGRGYSLVKKRVTDLGAAVRLRSGSAWASLSAPAGGLPHEEFRAVSGRLPGFLFLMHGTAQKAA